MENEKRWIQISTVAENPRLLTMFLDKINEKDHVDFVKGVISSYTYTKVATLRKLVQEVEKYSTELLLSLLKEITYIIRSIENQTQEMCEIVLNKELEDAPNNCSSLFAHLKYQTNDMVERAVTADYRCYDYVKKELRSYDLALKAVKVNTTALQDIEVEYQTEELLTLVVEKRAKAVCWMNTQDDALRQKMYKLAMTNNLQAITLDIYNEMNEDLQQEFKDLCIEHSYFPDELMERLCFTQQALYTMLKERKQWVGSYRIFKLLNEQYQLKVLKEGILLYGVQLSVEELQKIQSEEYLKAILPKCRKETIREYLCYCAKNNMRLLKDILMETPKFLAYINVSAIDDKEFIEQLVEQLV